MAEEDLIGVVTVTYNSAAVLPDFLRCMSEQTHQNFVLFVVDNASKDDTMSVLRGCSDTRLTVIANSDNRGVAAANNQGICASLEAGCSSILLINNDTEFGATLIEQLNEGLTKYSAEMTCPKIMFYDAPERIWAAGAKFLPWLGYMSVCLGEGKIDRGQYDRAELVSDAPTCCTLISSTVFERIGLMDERYFVYVDDSDFMYRAWTNHLKLMYLPHIKLLHKAGSLTGGKESPFAVLFGTRNRVFFQLKYFGVIRTLPWILVRQLSFLYEFLVARKGFKWLWLKEKAILDAFEMYTGHSSGHPVFRT